jgi:hypothetical protein
MSEPSAPAKGPEPSDDDPDLGGAAEGDEEVDPGWSLQYLGPYEYVDRTPTYLRLRFVIGTVVLAAALAAVLLRWGSPEDRIGSEDVAAPDMSVPAAAEADGAAATAQSCPSAAGGSNLEAAKTIRLFLAATAGQRFEGLQMDPEVEAQLGGAGTAAPLLRATRIGGFSTAEGTVSSCMRAWWFDGEQLRSSIDLVSVSPGLDGWKVSGWARGQPMPSDELAAVQLAFFNNPKRCDEPDRFASVEVPGGTPDEQLASAMDELLSGAAGRATGAASVVPADVQVVDARVEGLKATVELTGTSEKLTRCQSSASYDQIVSTASAVVLANVPPSPTPTTTARSRKGAPQGPTVEVEVLVDGQVVSTLKP